jgi:hypothetical protein
MSKIFNNQIYRKLLQTQDECVYRACSKREIEILISTGKFESIRTDGYIHFAETINDDLPYIKNAEILVLYNKEILIKQGLSWNEDYFEIEKIINEPGLIIDIYLIQ